MRTPLARHGRPRGRFIRPLLLAMLLAAAPAAVAPALAQRPPAPAAEAPVYEIAEEEVAFEAAGVTIRGSLTHPRAEGRFPAILFIAGSGPTDRDWLNLLIPGTNGSARLLAEELTRTGRVVLRYDKRGTGRSGMPEQVTIEDYLAEQRAALDLLRGLAFVDPGAIYVAGHSEGGAHALNLASQPDAGIAGLILLATSGRTFRDLILDQLATQFRGAGFDGEPLEAQMTPIAQALDRIAAGEAVDPAEASPFPGVRMLVRQLASPAAAGFVRFLLTFDPAQAFTRFDLPILIINGAKDIQVDPVEDAARLDAAARAAGRTDVTLVIAPNADHVLKYEEADAATLGPTTALRYNADDRRLAPVVVDAIETWLAAHAGR